MATPELTKLTEFSILQGSTFLVFIPIWHKVKDTLKDVNSRTGGDLFEISEDVACSTVKQKLTF